MCNNINLNIIHDLKKNKKYIMNIIIVFVISKILTSILFTYIIELLDVNFYTTEICSSLISIFLCLKFYKIISTDYVNKQFIVIVLMGIISILLLNKYDVRYIKYNNTITNNIANEQSLAKNMDTLSYLFEYNILNPQNYNGRDKVVLGNSFKDGILISNEPIGASIFYGEVEILKNMGLKLNGQYILIMLTIILSYILLKIIIKNENMKLLVFDLIINISIVFYAYKYDIFYIFLLLVNLLLWHIYLTCNKKAYLMNIILIINSIYFLHGGAFNGVAFINSLFMLKNDRIKGVISFLISFIIMNNYMFTMDMNLKNTLIYYILVVIMITLSYKLDDKKIIRLYICIGLVIMSMSLMVNPLPKGQKTLDKYSYDIIKETLNKNSILLYEDKFKELAQKISNTSYSEVIPINNIKTLFEIKELLPNRDIYYLGEKIKNNESINLDVEDLRKAYITNINSYKENQLNKKLYPDGLFECKGIYEGDVWSNGQINLYGKLNVSEQYKYLVLKRSGYNNPLINENQFNLEVYINNEEANLEKISKDNKFFYFKIPTNITNILNINIVTNTFIPKEYKIADDTRNLGIDIDEIMLEEKLND